MAVKKVQPLLILAARLLRYIIKINKPVFRQGFYF